MLQVHNRYRLMGGEDRAADTDRMLLERAGHEVERFEAVNPAGAAGSAAAMLSSPSNPVQSRRLRKVIKGFAPDVAHVHNTWFTLTPTVIRVLSDAGVPVVQSLHNFRPLCVGSGFFREGRPCQDCLGRSPWRGVVHRCYRDSVVASTASLATTTVHRALSTRDRVDAFMAPSEWVRSTYVKGGFPPGKIHLTPWVTEDPGPRALAPSCSRTVLYVGRLAPNKGAATLAKAWRRLDPGSGLRLKVVGDGDLAATLSVDPTIEVTGWQPRATVIEEMLGARALLCPSDVPETFGFAVAEAMAAGLPVLASDRGALPELVPGGSVVPAGDADAWAAAIAELGSDRLVDELGMGSRGRYEERYSLSKGLDRLLEVYREVVPDAVK